MRNRSVRAITGASLAAAALALSGCASAVSSTAGVLAPPPPAPSLNAGQPSDAGSPSAPACTSHSCVAEAIAQGLVGLQARDGAAITRASCKASTVKHNAGNTWSVHCTVTESDGSVIGGVANYFANTDEITFEPTS